VAFATSWVAAAAGIFLPDCAFTSTMKAFRKIFAAGL
jgi:hypothetical protein